MIIIHKDVFNPQHTGSNRSQLLFAFIFSFQFNFRITALPLHASEMISWKEHQRPAHSYKTPQTAIMKCLQCLNKMFFPLLVFCESSWTVKGIVHPKTHPYVVPNPYFLLRKTQKAMLHDVSFQKDRNHTLTVRTVP